MSKLKDTPQTKKAKEQYNNPIIYILFANEPLTKEEIGDKLHVSSDRQITRNIKKKIGKLQVVGEYSMYAYENFTKDEELEFFNKIVKYQNERIKVKQKEIGNIIEERDIIIDLIKEKER